VKIRKFITAGAIAASMSLAVPGAALAATGNASHSSVSSISSVALHASGKASAGIAATSPCAGRSATYIVEYFYRGPAAYPLRCGTSTWGYNHLIKHGYNSSLISLTVARGTQDSIFQIFTYVLEEVCPTPVYTVVYNEGALNGNGVRPQGIITAYETIEEGPDCA
jgi:hypothetical protein